MNRKRRSRKGTALDKIAAALKEAMSRDGVNITQMAKDMGVARNQLYLIIEKKRKHTPKYDTLEKVATYLGLEMVVQEMS